ncbi:MAG: exonuclease SbcCD subunit D [Bacillota bacterium]
MKAFHLGDLHLGKRVHEFSMIEDQKYILEKIVGMAREQAVDIVLISGDVFDKSVPSVEGVQLFDEFLNELAEANIKVFLIAGNHDSAQRLSYGRTFFAKRNVHIVGEFLGEIEQVTLADEYGNFHIHMLPFVKPAHVSPYFDEDILTYEDGVRVALSHHKLNLEERNIILAHQFVTYKGKAEESDSEMSSVGGIDHVDASHFFDYDYVALGHLHSPQKMGRDTIRYAGSPLAYSFSEIHREKAVTCIEFHEKGNLEVTLLPIQPLRAMREIKGELAQLMEVAKEVAKKNGESKDYIRAILTDSMIPYDAIGQLRSVYPNIMNLVFESRQSASAEVNADIKKNIKPQVVFSEFFEAQNGRELSEVQLEIVNSVWERLERDVQ